MTATLAICIIIAATMISIGIARAGVIGPTETGLSAGLSMPVAAALFIILSCMALSGFTAIGALLLATRQRGRA